MSSTYPLIITKKNLVSGSTNTFLYNFSKSIDFQNVDIGLASANIYHSWRNITSAKNNHQFTILHPATLATNDTLLVTVPDGGYEITDLNNYLRYFLIAEGYYIQNDSTEEQIVYCKFQVNPNTYSIDFITYPMPTSLPTGFTAGSAITFPSTTRAPQLVISTNNFGTVIGFAAGTFPVVQATVLTTVGSTLLPVVTDVQSILVSIDSAMNTFSPNSRVIYSISPAGIPYSGLINDKPSTISYCPQQGGHRNSITLQLTNQFNVPLDIVDPDLTIMLLLRVNNKL